MNKIIAAIALSMLAFANLALAESNNNITIQQALYGTKIATPPGSTKDCSTAPAASEQINYMTDLASQCDGQNSCQWQVPYPSSQDDPAQGCFKNFEATFTCGDSTTNRTVDIGGVVNEAAKQDISLFCGDGDGITVESATYGETTTPKYVANCSNIAEGNATQQVSNLCNGHPTCTFPVDVGTLGDPAKGCLKNFKVNYTCGASQETRTTTVPAEANGKGAELDCSGSGPSPTPVPTSPAVYLTLDQTTISDTRANALFSYDIQLPSGQGVSDIKIYWRHKQLPEPDPIRWNVITSNDFTLRNYSLGNVLAPYQAYEMYIFVRLTQEAQTIQSAHLCFTTGMGQHGC